jgi:hypothetical protein
MSSIFNEIPDPSCQADRFNLKAGMNSISSCFLGQIL